MPVYRMQQAIETVDNVSANYATNTLHFLADSPAILPTITTLVTTFYTTIRPQFSALVRQTGHKYKWYDLADPQPRAPVLEGSWSFSSAPAGSALPPEVALCVSFQGEKISGQPQARRRGRIFLPFFNTTAGGADGRPATGTITQINGAADALLTASKAATTWTWIVLSALNPTDGAVVDNGWIDDEWDTQRRRGRVSVSRQVFS